MRVCRISCAPRAGAGLGLRAQNNNNNNNVNFNGWFGWGKKETPPAPAVAVQEPEEEPNVRTSEQITATDDWHEIFLKTGVDTRTPEKKAADEEWCRDYVSRRRANCAADREIMNGINEAEWASRSNW